MKQVFKHYKYWEDYNNGLYKKNTNYNKNEKIMQSFNLLSNNNIFYEKGIEMVKSWEVSALVNLTNLSINRIAWVGQATCCYNHGANESSTIEAWWSLSQKQRDNADNVAKKIIEYWEIYIFNKVQYGQDTLGI